MPEIGQNLSHYTLVEKIGKGGMGEVFRAKDQKLGRDVAIKVLPEEFAKDAERVARFQREAKLLASLNHPNIAAIHGLEESDGTHFLVLELVAGDTLSDRIKAGPIPVEDSLKLALQIAEALEAAHEKGVIHRDLKPSNIKVTPEGKVKVLDFGLAKAYAGEQEDMILSDSPTISAAATQKGVILGTAAYMSPEQARGKPVDKRADIWAFGCVLFEMLTGRTAFSGKDVTDILAAVIRAEPEWNSLPTNLHWRLREVLERCLEKDAKDRYSGINDARVDIQKVLTDPSGVFVQPVPTAESRARLRTMLPWIAGTVILGAIIVGTIVWNLRPTEQHRVMRFDYSLPEGQRFNVNLQSAGDVLAVSSDGSRFVYSTSEGLYLRSEEQLEARLILGTKENPHSPFFSPDGQWIGYWSLDDGKLKKISINGGAPVALCDVSYVDGAIWYADNTIVYADIPNGIMRVSANGGTPETLVAGMVGSPQLLPDGKSILFSDFVSTPNQIVVQSLESGERKELFPGGGARYLPIGHLVYWLQNNLFAVPFDIDKLEATGGPVPIVEGTTYFFAISDSGTLVYIPGTVATESSATPQRTLVWVDRKGGEEPLEAPANTYRYPKISPDGTKVALTIDKDNIDIWIWDLVYKNLTRLTFDNLPDRYPLWTPDGKRIVFQSTAREGFAIYWKAADGTGEVEQLCSVPKSIALVPYSWSSDGSTLLMHEASGTTRADIGTLSMEGDHTHKPLLQQDYIEAMPQVSPDGCWIAYCSNESGQDEIYVRPFPDVNKGRWQVSADGGNSPLWSPDGRELFYLTGRATTEAVMRVAVETGSSFKRSTPEVLFRGTYVGFGPSTDCPSWDIHPDGKRFLMMKEHEPTAEESTTEAPHKINVVLNFFEELKQRVPVP